MENLKQGTGGSGRRIEERIVDVEEGKMAGRETEEERRKRDGGEGEKEKEGIWPSLPTTAFGLASLASP